MGMKGTVQSAVITAFAALGDLVEDVAWVQPTKKKIRNQITGAITSVDETETIEGVFVDYEAKEIDGHRIKLGDAQILSASQPWDLTPQVGDLGTRAFGEVWRVISIKTDPADALYMIQVRRNTE